jgi:hypothetical protein
MKSILNKLKKNKNRRNDMIEKNVKLIGKKFDELDDNQQESILQQALDVYYEFEPRDTLSYYIGEMNKKYQSDLIIDDFQYDLYEGWIEVISRKFASIIYGELQNILGDYLFANVMDVHIDSKYIHIGRRSYTEWDDSYIDIFEECSDELADYIREQAAIVYDNVMNDFEDLRKRMVDIMDNAYDYVKEVSSEYIYFVDEYGRVYDREEYNEFKEAI